MWASISLAASSANVEFTIDNGLTLFAPGTNVAFSNLGGPNSDSFFDWGLPFFFGRTAYTVMEGARVQTADGARPGPLYAFSN